MIEYECFICKGTVSGEDTTSSLDPCTIVLVANFDRVRDEQREQQFFCHFECFRRVVNNDGIMNIMEPDFSTIGECSEDEEEQLN